MRCWTLEWKEADRNEFVRYWASQYLDTNERLYVEHIEQPLTADTVRALFQWKNGGKLSVLKQRSVETNYIARLDELARLPSDLDGAEFLRLWARGGAIWRIFWLHCWKPKRFPIYDQHVYRAAARMCHWDGPEIPASDPRRIATYLERYLPFWEELGINSRDADRALWAFGKFLKGWNGALP